MTVTRAARVTACLLAVCVAAAAAAVGAQPASGPARLVSTSPSVTETLFALGLGDRVVGVSSYCRFPAAVATLPRVGTFLQPDVERIARLRPDLVLVQAGPRPTASQLNTLGIATASVGSGNSLASVFATIREIGKAVGIPGRADTVVGDLNAELTRVKGAVAGRPPRKVLIVIGRRTGTLTDIVAVGRGSYLDDLAAIAGGVNVLSSTSGPAYPRISMETVISLAPDVLIDIGEMGESPDDSDRRRQATERLWRAQTLVKAVRDGRVHVSVDEAFVVPGPRLTTVARTMAEWFHAVRVP